MLQVQQIGYLGNDARTEEINGNRVINFSVASTEKYQGKDGKEIEITTWLNCSFWTTSKVDQWLKKGSLIYVQGTLSAAIIDVPTTSEKAIRLNCRVSKVELLNTKQATNGNG